jgi:hypothetical protein
MIDAIRKELQSAGENSVDQLERDQGAKIQATIFEGGDRPRGRDWSPIGSEEKDNPQTVWEYHEGRLYRFFDWQDPRLADAQGEDVLPSLYVAIRPFDPEDLNHPHQLENIEHLVNLIASKHLGEVEAKYQQIPARYREEKRLLLIKIGEKLQ